MLRAPGERLTIEYQLREDEAVEAFEQGGIRLPRPLLYFGFGAGGFGTGVLMVLGEWYLAGMAGTICFGVPTLARLLTRGTVRQNARKYLGPMSVRIEEDAFSIASAGSETEYKSRALKQWRETERLMLIYPQWNIFYMVPKRAFSDEQLSLFRARLRDWIGPEGVLKT